LSGLFWRFSFAQGLGLGRHKLLSRIVRLSLRKNLHITAPRTKAQTPAAGQVFVSACRHESLTIFFVSLENAKCSRPQLGFSLREICLRLGQVQRKAKQFAFLALSAQ